MGTHREMFPLAWTFIVVSCLMDPRNLQVHSKFWLIETVDGNYKSPHPQDFSSGTCVDQDKTQCSTYSDQCGDNTVARLCQKTCGLCPEDRGGNGNGKGSCFDRDKTQCAQYSDRCNDATVGNLCRKTCGFCKDE